MFDRRGSRDRCACTHCRNESQANYGGCAGGGAAPQGQGAAGGRAGGAQGRAGGGGGGGGAAGRGAAGAFTPTEGAKDLKTVLFNWTWRMGMLRSGAESELVKTLDYHAAGGTIRSTGSPAR